MTDPIPDDLLDIREDAPTPCAAGRLYSCGAIAPTIHEARSDGKATPIVAHMGIGLPNARGCARRLCACWNFCDGTATEYLEAAPNLGRCIVEQAELLAACEEAAAMLDEDAEQLQRRDLSSSAAHVLSIRDLLVAAIAKAKGETL